MPAEQTNPESEGPGGKRSSRATRALFFLLLASVILAPLPQGARESWAASLDVAWVGGLLLLAAGIALFRGSGALGNAGAWRPELRLPAALFAATCTWALVQWSPWTPSALHHPLWADAAGTLGQVLPGRISLNPGATLAALVQLLAYGVVFGLALALGRDRARAQLGLRVFVYASLAYAVYGIAAFFASSEYTLWFGKRMNIYSLTSTFVNRNTYATFAGMGLIAAFALFLDGLGRPLRARVPPRTRARWALRHLFGPGAPLLVAVIVLASALLLTASRAGTLSGLLGLLVLSAATLRAGTLPARFVSAIAAVFVVAGILVFALSGERLAKRLEHLDPKMEGRGAVYAVILGALGDAPLLGTGYGTFPDVFPLYRDGSIERTARWKKAHNTYLENALELGLPAALALWGSIAACARLCWLGIRRRRRDRIYPMVAVAVTTLVAAHSLVDFSLQLPAVSYAYALLLGLGCAQSFSSRPAEGAPEPGRP